MLAILLLIGASRLEAFVGKPRPFSLSRKMMAVTTNVLELKNDLINLCSNVIVGEAVPEHVTKSIRECVESIEAMSTQTSLAQSLSNFDGEWLMLYSTLPSFFKRIALSSLSAGTIPSAEELILVSRVKQIVKQNPTGEYSYDNLVEFSGSKVDSTAQPLPGLHITRGTAVVNVPESTDNALRFNVAFYENEAYSPSSSKEDIDHFKRLFGFKPEDSLLGKFPAAFKSWSDIVYLDETLRIMRGGKGNIYVLQKK